jgi:hypothetical protein
MRASRRDVLRVLAQTAAFYGLGGAAASAEEATPTASFEETLADYLDTLMPDDELGPGATELGLLDPILDEAMANPDVQTFLEKGVRWLTEEARSQGAEDFTGLSEDGRNQLVAAAEAAKFDSLENEFFRATRYIVFRLYYMEPQAWPAIGYDGPPQPVGFPNYTAPPARGD